MNFILKEKTNNATSLCIYNTNLYKNNLDLLFKQNIIILYFENLLFFGLCHIIYY